MLAAGFDQPPHILEVGCGDVREIAAMLKRDAVADHTGIDNSPAALGSARLNLAGRPFP